MTVCYDICRCNAGNIYKWIRIQWICGARSWRVKWQWMMMFSMKSVLGVHIISSPQIPTMPSWPWCNIFTGLVYPIISNGLIIGQVCNHDDVLTFHYMFTGPTRVQTVKKESINYSNEQHVISQYDRTHHHHLVTPDRFEKKMQNLIVFRIYSNQSWHFPSHQIIEQFGK